MKCVAERDSILKRTALIAILAFLVWILWLASYRAAQNDNWGVGNEPQRNPEQRSVVNPEKCQIDALNQALKQAIVKELRSIWKRYSRSMLLVARERFELSSAGPEPAMLDHYTRRKDAFPPPGFPGQSRVHYQISLIKLSSELLFTIRNQSGSFEVSFKKGLQSWYLRI